VGGGERVEARHLITKNFANLLRIWASRKHSKVLGQRERTKAVYGGHQSKLPWTEGIAGKGRRREPYQNVSRQGSRRINSG